MRALVVIPLLSLAACTEDPIYVPAADPIEVGTGEPDDLGIATAMLELPYDLAYLTQDQDYQRDRAARLAEINRALEADGQPPLADDQLPLVRLDQLEISIEYTIENLSEEPGQARVHLNGGNQYFYYVPDEFVVPAAPGEEEDPPPPPLSGDIPIDVAAGDTISGVFREDQLREAAIDLEIITRGGVNPFAALLSVHEDITNVLDVPYIPVDPENPMPPMLSLPIAAFGHFVRFDITFEADRHMVFRYTVRVRESEPLLHDELTDAPAGELMVFMPALYTPPELVTP